MSESSEVGGDAARIARVSDYLRDAVVELEVWRQNARSPEERHAMQRVIALLGLAATALNADREVADPAQATFQLPGVVGRD